MLSDKIKGCLYAGAIGDCMGGIFENSAVFDESLLNEAWQISDDTQLTLATCESIIEHKKAIPEKIAGKFLQWFNARKITGIGSSTLQAMRALQVGGHWALAGRQGEYAAGNGAAMRIAPLAFIDADRQTIRDVCRITHRNDEAYTGTLAVVESIKTAINGKWGNDGKLIPQVIEAIPDTRTRDRLIELAEETGNISTVSKKYGNSGYVVDTVPLAIYATQQIGTLSFEAIMIEIIKGGGDTDTICSIAGNIIGAFVGIGKLPVHLYTRLMKIKEALLLDKIIASFTKLFGDSSA